MASVLLRPRVLGFVLVLAAVLTAVVPSSMGDYVRFVPTVDDLHRGDLGGASADGPIYAASLLLRLPGSLLADLLGGSDVAIYQGGAVVCMLVVAALAWFLAQRLTELRRDPSEVMVVVAVVMGAAALLSTIRFGHPEEPLAAALAVGGILAAYEARPALSGVLLALALCGKPWAVIAVVPALLAAPFEGRKRLLVVYVALSAAVLGPLWLVAQATGTAGTGTSELFAGSHYWRPQQLFFYIGTEHSNVSGGITYTAWRGPAWYSAISHPAAVVLVLPLAFALYRRHARLGTNVGLDALGLFGMCMLVRCAIDPWNITYYAVPAVMALGAWEGLTRRGLPVLSLLAAAGTWLAFNGQLVSAPFNSETRFWTYVAFVVPVLAEVWRRLYYDAGLHAAVQRSVVPATPTTAAGVPS